MLSNRSFEIVGPILAAPIEEGRWFHTLRRGYGIGLCTEERLTELLMFTRN